MEPTTPQNIVIETSDDTGTVFIKDLGIMQACLEMRLKISHKMALMTDDEVKQAVSELLSNGIKE